MRVFLYSSANLKLNGKTLIRIPIFHRILLIYLLILNQYIHISLNRKNRIYFIRLSISFFFQFHLRVFYARETRTQYDPIILEPVYSRSMFSK